MDHSSLAERFRANIESLCSEPMPQTHLLQTARQWHPEALAAVTEIVEEAQRVFPTACVSVVGITRQYWRDMFDVRISARRPDGISRKVPYWLEFEVSPDAIIWEDREGIVRAIRRGEDPAAFGQWLADEAAAWLRDLGFRPLGL